MKKRGDGSLEWISHSESETEDFGCRLAHQLHGGSVVAFHGGLGMGKTAFSRGIARGLGYAGRVTSPTFTVVNEYPGALPMFHFDMYRLSNSDALFDIGWEDYLERGGVCVVEWSENVADALPPETVTVELRRCAGHDDWRSITVTGGNSHENTGA